MTQIFQLLGGVFIPYPLIALVPAVVFGLFYYSSKNKTILWSAIVWVLYALYEELHLLRIVCSGECNIRIDLFVIYPILIIISLVALVLGIKNISSK